MPFKEKLNAILYISSNCKTNSHRQDLVPQPAAAAAAESSLQLHSYGECDRNMGVKELQELAAIGVTKLGRRYKFCLACADCVLTVC